MLRILAELGKHFLAREVRERLLELESEPLGFVARALGERHREIRAEGRYWTDGDITDFIERRLPVALDQAAAARLANELPSSGKGTDEAGG